MTINPLLNSNVSSEAKWLAGETAEESPGADFLALLDEAEATPEEPAESEAPPVGKSLPPLVWRDPATLLRELQTLVQQRFADAGLSLEPPVSFSSDTSGYVQAHGNRGDLAQIEELFAGDRELHSAYMHWQVNQEVQAALDRHMAFVKEYERDPVAASKLLPLPKGAPFSLKFSGDAVEVIGG